MALNIQNVTRKFSFKKKDGKTIVLEDSNPAFTPEEVLNFHSNVHPELTTATIAGPNMKEDVAEYEFKTTVGTKG